MSAAPAPRSPESTPAWGRRDSVWLGGFALLAAVIALATAMGSPVDDTWRDLYFAHRIANGEAFPLRGPVIGNVSQLGPVWYYVLALPYALGGVGAVLATIGALAGLKFALAFAFGRRLGGTALGAAFGLALLMPTWNALEPAWPTHISVVATLLFALALAALRLRAQPALPAAMLVGLLGGLLVQAHPTAALPGAALGLWSLATVSGWRTRIGLALAMGASATLPMLPLWLSQAWLTDTTAPDNLLGVGAHLQSLPLASIAERLLPLLRGLVWGAAEMQWGVWIAVDGAARATPLALHAIGLVLAALGCLRLPPAWRRLAGGIALLLLLQSLFVLALRATTPFWMSYAHGPLLAALAALGGWAWWRASRVAGAVLLLIVGVHALGTALVLWHLAFPAQPTRGPLFAPGSAGMGSITSRITGTRVVYPIRVDAAAWQRMGARLCTPVVTYGHLASMLDVSLGMGVRRACGRVEQIALGGPLRDAQPALIGLSADASRAIGVPPPRRDEGLRVLPVIASWNAGAALPIVPGGRYPRRDLTHLQGAQNLVEGEADAAAVIAVALRAIGHHAYELQSVQVDGEAQSPRYQDVALALYRCEHCAPGTQHRWRIRFSGPQELVDVVVFDPQAALR